MLRCNDLLFKSNCAGESAEPEVMPRVMGSGWHSLAWIVSVLFFFFLQFNFEAPDVVAIDQHCLQMGGWPALPSLPSPVGASHNVHTN